MTVSLIYCSSATIGNWIKTYIEDGLDGLLTWEYKGKASKLSAKQIKELKLRNKEKPFSKAKEAKSYIEENFNIKFHLHWVQKILKKIEIVV